MKGNFVIIAALLSGFTFWGGSSVLAYSETYSVDSSGSGLVPNVLQFQAIAGDKHISLSWENPENADLSGVSIVRGDQNYLSVYDANSSIYKGSDKSYIDLELTNDTTYYYTIFAYNSKGVYSSGSIAKATPKLPSLTDPYQRASSDYLDINQQKPFLPAKKINKIELTDFYYYLVINKKVLQIGLNDSNELHAAAGSTVLIEIPSNIFLEAVNVISVSTEESSYLMTLVPDQNKYQLVISTSKNSGEQQLRFVTVFKNKTISEIKTKLIVDPLGNIYQKGSSFLDFGKTQEMRIEGAKVVIYWKDEGSWKVWNAEKYFQENPQITNSSGEYAFFVPKGEYFLEVSKTGFWYKKTDPFTVGPELLNVNVAIVPWIDPRVCVGVVLAATLLLIFWARRRSQTRC